MSHDTWVHKGVRALVRPLAHTSVSPNQVTAVRLVTGIGAAAAVSFGPGVGHVVGAGLFLVSFLLDRADGELARLSGKTSPSGHAFDLWADAICTVLIFVALGIGLGAWAVPMGIAAGGAVALMFWVLYRVEASETAGDIEIGPCAGFDPDDAVLLVPLALLMGWADGLLVLSAVIAPVCALLFLFVFRRDLRQSPSRPATAAPAVRDRSTDDIDLDAS